MASARKPQDPPAPRPFSIAMAREVGTRGTAVAIEVGKRLGWHVYDHELLEHIAREMGLRTALLESIDEKHQSWLWESIGASLASLVSGGGTPWATEVSYVHHLIETVHALGVHGECVIVGRGAAFILPPETTLRVRLVGLPRERIRALSRTLGISERDASKQVRAVDRERNDFIRDHFLRDPTDPDNYDLLVNAVRLSTARVADLVVDTLERVKAQETEMTAGKLALPESVGAKLG